MDDTHLTLMLVLSERPTGTPAEEDAVEGLADRIERDVMGIGEVVGYDVGDGMAQIYVGGTDVGRLTSIVLSLARTLPWREGSHLVVADGGREQRIDL